MRGVISVLVGLLGIVHGFGHGGLLRAGPASHRSSSIVMPIGIPKVGERRVTHAT